MASITKLMTALVALERASPDEVVTAPRAQPGSESRRSTFARASSSPSATCSVALIQSANDAANAVAAHVGGTVPRFVALMKPPHAPSG